jgi:hypothetical protein
MQIDAAMIGLRKGERYHPNGWQLPKANAFEV